jgi:hypothetical protein
MCYGRKLPKLEGQGKASHWRGYGLSSLDPRGSNLKSIGLRTIIPELGQP